MRHLLSTPPPWLAATILWAITLYTLSSFSKTLPDGSPEIPNLDKILHFGYFLGGGFILATYFLLKKAPAPSLAARFIIPLLILATIGALDEYHQTFTPGRSGNDPFDWLADLLGAATGILLAAHLHPLLLSLLLRLSSHPEKS